MRLQELFRRLNNIVQIGTIDATKCKEGKALARVVLDNEGGNKRVSRFLPVISMANSFIKVWVPVKVGEQVLVISPFGNDGGFIFRSIFNKGCKEPSGANEHTAIMEFDDGTRLSYDSKASDLKVDAVKSINVLCQTANVDASQNIYMKAPITTIESDTTIKGTLTVEQLLTAQGGMKVFAAASQAIGAVFECEIESNKDITALNLRATQKVYDEQGNLTDHTNQSYSRD